LEQLKEGGTKGKGKKKRERKKRRKFSFFVFFSSSLFDFIFNSLLLEALAF